MFVWSQKFSLRVWTPIYEHVQICLMFGMSLENDVRVRSMFDKMVFDPSLPNEHNISALLSQWQISKISIKKGKRDSFDFVMTLQWEIQEHFGEVVVVV